MLEPAQPDVFVLIGPERMFLLRLHNNVPPICLHSVNVPVLLQNRVDTRRFILSPLHVSSVWFLSSGEDETRHLKRRVLSADS